MSTSVNLLFHSSSLAYPVKVPMVMSNPLPPRPAIALRKSRTAAELTLPLYR
jgi:hypothetical protein